MKLKIIIFILSTIYSSIALAQTGFQISGRINNLQAKRIFLISEESGRRDTLGVSNVSQGAFMLKGNVEFPQIAYLEIEGISARVPLILENARFMLNIGENGALVQGGSQQEIFNQFNKLNGNLLKEQERITQEYHTASKAKNQAQMDALVQKLEQAVQQARATEMSLLKQNADTYVAALVIASSCRNIKPELLKERYALLGENARQTIPGKQIARYLEEENYLTEGNILPDFTVISSSGDSLSLYPLKSKLKLIVFWSSDSPVCRQANVKLLDLYQKYKLRGLEIISLSQDQDFINWKKAIELDGMFWKNGWDREHSIAYRYHIAEFPYVLLVDKEHKILVKGIFTTSLCDSIISFIKKNK